MGKKIFSCEELSLSHEQMLELKQAGLLQLGIDDTHSAQISVTKGVTPTKTTASAAFHFWNLVAFGALGYTIYLSFTSDWWWFLIGLVVVNVIWQASKKGNSQNLLDTAMMDEAFYERVRELGGWFYQMDEAEAEKYRDATIENEAVRPRNVIADFGDFLDQKSIVGEIRDVSELPHTKSDILDSICSELGKDQDEIVLEQLKIAALFLADFQEDVGGEPLRQLGISSAEMQQLSNSEAMDRIAENPTREKYEHFNKIVQQERKAIEAMLMKAERTIA